MKTLNILFEEPNVFKVLLEWPSEHDYSKDSVYDQKQYSKACEQSKANAIRIENFGILPFTISFDTWFDLTDQRHIQHGDIFQVEGFEYETDCRWKDVGEDKIAPEKIAILKLAKEEEPKEQDYLTIIDESTTKILNLIDAEIRMLDTKIPTKTYEQDRRVKYKNQLIKLIHIIENINY